MKCCNLRDLLADGGPAALAGNQTAEDHLVECGECYAVLEALAEVDELLPALESHDVADEVVERLLARPELKRRRGIGATASLGRLFRLVPLRRLGAVIDRARQVRIHWGVVAVPAVLLIGFVSFRTFFSSQGAVGGAPTSELSRFVVDQVVAATPQADGRGDLAERESSEEQGRLSGTKAEDADEIGAGFAGGRDRQVEERLEAGKKNAPQPARSRISIPRSEPMEPEPIRELEEDLEAVEFYDADIGDVVAPPPPPQFRTPIRSVNWKETPDQVLPNLELQDTPMAKDKAKAGALAEDATTPADGNVSGNVRREEKSRAYKKQSVSANNQAMAEPRELRRKIGEFEVQMEALRNLGEIEEADRLDSYLREFKKGLGLEGDEVGGGKNTVDKIMSVHGSTPARQQPASPVSANAAALTTAQRFLDARSQLEDLTFREGRGYWANTYVPGDRTLRQLKARLDRAQGEGATGTLHDSSRQISQPFDAPDTAALAVYLHADRRGVTARERMLVQVGIRGTPRRSGVRPAMNVGLVLDLRGEVDNTTATSLRALLAAFAASSELGDRISLTVAGRPGGTILPPGDLRHGPLTVAMGELFGDRPSGPVLGLEQAVVAALATVRADDDPDAALGSSAVIVITAQRLGGVTSRLASMAHQSAVDGVPWSVIGVGQAVDLAELDALVLAGQGNRRLLTSAADAESLVDRELAAVSRVVARAVRLRIRLAPGVQLVNVIGSERLDERRAQQVRDAEQAVDQRLSRNLGIQADRGLDEDGIQIVIPSFYADDAHVVLLDVVVPGSGPVADVTVRYKDLVHMKNGVAQAHLRVARSSAGDGPLERNVFTNLIATEVASRLDRAADALLSGNLAVAQAIISDTLSLVQGIILQVDGLAQDRDLSSDVKMLTNYLQALSGLPANDATQLRLAADSLRYAGRLKILPPPIGDDKSGS